MLTIYEKETLIESLDETFTEIKAYVEGAIGQEALHDVEQHLFRRLQSLGRGLMETRGSRPQGSCFLDFLLRYLHAGQGVVSPSYSVRTFFLGTHRSYEGSPPDFKAPLSAL